MTDFGSTSTLLKTIEVIAADVCDGLKTSPTPAKRAEITKASGKAYVSRLRRFRSGRVTPAAHEKVALDIITALRIKFDSYGGLTLPRTAAEKKALVDQLIHDGKRITVRRKR